MNIANPNHPKHWLYQQRCDRIALIALMILGFVFLGYAESNFTTFSWDLIGLMFFYLCFGSVSIASIVSIAAMIVILAASIRGYVWGYDD